MSPPIWTSTTDQPTPASARRPTIAEIHVLMQGLEPGQSEVQIRWPNGATGASASAVQAKLIATAIKEIEDAAALLSG
jgi:hypothetical protein